MSRPTNRPFGPIRVEHIDAKGDPTAYSPGPTTEPDTVSGSFTCLCGAVLHWSGPHNGSRGLNEDGTPHTCPTVEPKPYTPGPWVYSDLTPEEKAEVKRVRWYQPSDNPTDNALRSYLRTLTNPDAPAEDVAAALALLTDEDRELVAALTKRNP